jgi:hypothetical protein
MLLVLKAGIVCTEDGKLAVVTECTNSLESRPESVKGIQCLYSNGIEKVIFKNRRTNDIVMGIIRAMAPIDINDDALDAWVINNTQKFEKGVRLTLNECRPILIDGEIITLSVSENYGDFIITSSGRNYQSITLVVLRNEDAFSLGQMRIRRDLDSKYITPIDLQTGEIG